MTNNLSLNLSQTGAHLWAPNITMKWLYCNYYSLFGRRRFTPLRKALREQFNNDGFDSYVYCLIFDMKIIKIGSSNERKYNLSSNKSYNGRYFLQRIPMQLRDYRDYIGIVNHKLFNREDLKIFMYLIKDDKQAYKCQKVEYHLKDLYFSKHNEKPRFDKN